MNVGTLFVNMFLDKSKYDAALDQAEARAKTSGGMIKNALVSTLTFGGVTAALYGMTSAFKNAIGAGISFDASLQQNQVTFTTLLGSSSAAKKMLQQFADFAQSTPFDLLGVEQSAKQMLAMGFNAKEVLPDMRKIGDAAAALGLTTDGINRVTLALGQLKTHGTADAQDLLQLTEAGIPVWDILSKAMGKPIPVLKKLVTKGMIPANVAVKDLIDGMESRFPNMLKKQGNTFISQVGNLSDGLKRALGDALKPGFNWLTNKMLPLLITKIDHFRAVLDKAGASAAFKTLFPPALVNTVVMLSNAVVTFFKFITTHGPLVKAIIAGIAAGFAAFKVASIIATVISWIRKLIVAEGILNVVMAMNPFGLIAIAVGVLVTAFIYMWQHWSQISKFLSQSWQSIKNLAISVWDGIKNFFINIWNSIVNFGKSIFQSEINFYVSLWTGFKNMLTNIVKGMVSAVVGWFSWLYNHNYYFKNLVDTVVSLFKWFYNIAVSIWRGISNFLSGLWRGIVSIGSSIWHGLVSTIMAIIRPIASFFSGVWHGIESLLSSVWHAIVGRVRSGANSAKSAATRPFTLLAGFFAHLAGEALHWGSNIIHSIAQGIRNAAGAVASAASHVAHRIASFLGFHSPSKEGPGSEADVWMPNLMNMLVDGIDQGIPKVQAKLNGVFGNQQWMAKANMKLNHSNKDKLEIHNHVYLDGQQVTQALGPHLMNEIRFATGF